MIDINILNKAKNAIVAKNKNAQKKAKDNLNTALQHEGFKLAYYSFQNAMIENAKKQAFNQTDFLDTSVYEKQMQAELKIMGLSKQDLLPNYSCKKCNDTGFVDNGICSCLKDEINKINAEQISSLNLCSFDDFDFSLFDNKQEITKVYETLKKWSITPNSKYNTILLTGKTGCGKTHLLKCVANNVIKNSHLTVVASAFMLNQDLLKFHTTIENKWFYLNKYLNCEYLFIDDLGCESIFKNVTIEGFYNIINERQERGKKTFITTNLGADDIVEKYDQRIFSRLANNHSSIIIEINNKDLRLNKSKK